MNPHPPGSLKNPLLWAVFLLYLLVAGFALANHEMWADELHSWNIAKGSKTFVDVFRNSRYEGHPPLWYIILWTIARFTHHLAAVQMVHLTIAAAAVFFYTVFLALSAFNKIAFTFWILFPFRICHPQPQLCYRYFDGGIDLSRLA